MQKFANRDTRGDRPRNPPTRTIATCRAKPRWSARSSPATSCRFSDCLRLRAAVKSILDLEVDSVKRRMKESYSPRASRAILRKGAEERPSRSKSTSRFASAPCANAPTLSASAARCDFLRIFVSSSGRRRVKQTQQLGSNARQARAQHAAPYK